VREHADLVTISYSRQYPTWLYPGPSDYDPSYVGHEEAGVQYLLDSLNPLTWAAVGRTFARHRPQMVIMPWWTVYWAPCYWFISRALKRRGIKLLFLLHNVTDHESSFWNWPLTRLVLSQGNGFIVQNRESEKKVQTLLPGAQTVVHPHPIISQLPTAVGSLPRRAELELLFFGFVREYKGIDVLLEALSLLPEDGFFLTIAGEWWPGTQGLLQTIDREHLRGKVEVIDRYMTQREVAEYFARADVVILPYKRSYGSAVLTLAYSYEKPVIATSIGAFRDLVTDGVSGRLVAPRDPQALAEAIHDFFSDSGEEMRQGIRDLSRGMTWESLVECILNFL
jgi:glycosyltransferase involved in cell wall biosynthesis